MVKFIYAILTSDENDGGSHGEESRSPGAEVGYVPVVKLDEE
jgi:hypothetical protein